MKSMETATQAYQSQPHIHYAAADPKRVVRVVEKRHRRAVVTGRQRVHRQNILCMHVQHDKIEGVGVIPRKGAKFLPTMNELVCNLLCQRVRPAHVDALLWHLREHQAEGRVVAKALERFARQASVEDAVLAVALVAVDE